MSTITAQIQLRRDTSANWTSNNPILLSGEIALTTDVFYTGTDQPRYKIGNGVDTWTNLDYVPEGSGSSYPENLYLTVVNKTGDNLLASGYKVLKVQDAQGQRLAVDYALADSDANSADTIGVVYENIDNNQTGKLVVTGELTGLDTTGGLQGESWNDGDLLFLSPFVNGGITNIRPTAPNHGVIIGYVVYVNSNNGKIYIKIDNGYEIGELHDVYAPNPNNNDGIFWSSGTTRYENKSITSALGITEINSCLFAQMQSINPSDNTLYFFGNIPFTPSNTAAGARFIPIPNDCTLKKIILVIRCLVGSNELTTFSLYKNGNLLTALPTTVNFSIANQIVNQDNLNINLLGGDYLEISFKNTWATNPTGVVIAAYLIIQ